MLCFFLPDDMHKRFTVIVFRVSGEAQAQPLPPDVPSLEFQSVQRIAQHPQACFQTLPLLGECCGV